MSFFFFFGLNGVGFDIGVLGWMTELVLRYLGWRLLVYVFL